MAEFSLPKNSRIKGKGKVHTSDAANKRTFKVYRYDPDSGENPRYDRFEIDMDDAMLVEEVQSFGCLLHHQQHLIDRNVGHPAYVMLEG